MKKILCLILAILMCFALAACGPSRRSSSSSSGSGKSAGGFVGSDGKYHKNIPEFGNDVNEWMKNNW